MRVSTTIGLAVGALAALLTLSVPTALADPSAPPSPVPPKAGSAPTDLAGYPKLPAGPLLPPGPDIGPGDIVAVQQLAGGYMQATFYMTAAGVGVEEHYRQLKAAGVPGLIDPATTSSTATATNDAPCSSGTARLECFTSDGKPVHWANGCCSHPQVWFVDHTSASWPVDTSTYTWNQTQGIDSIYVWGSCPHYSGQHCVNLWDANHGNSGSWLNTPGRTRVVWNTTTDDLINGSDDGTTGVRIDFNDYAGYNLTAAMRRQAVCQEQGHSLGMNHNTSTTSCMYNTALRTNTPQTPNNDDFNLLAKEYSYWHD